GSPTPPACWSAGAAATRRPCWMGRRPPTRPSGGHGRSGTSPRATTESRPREAAPSGDACAGGGFAEGSPLRPRSTAAERLTGTAVDTIHRLTRQELYDLVWSQPLK